MIQIKAIAYYENALKIAQDIGNRKDEGALFGSLGNSYSALGDARKAVEYYEKALKIARETGDRRNEGNWFGNLGLAYQDLGEVRKAIVCYEKALQIAQEIGDKRNESIWLNNLGIVLEDAKKYREALACYFLAIDICTQIENPNLKTTESNLKELEEKLGKKEFEKLAAEAAPRMEEIVRKMLEGTLEWKKGRKHDYY
jgi:tetratricopeptide (TPR) repeat protein